MPDGSAGGAEAVNRRRLIAELHAEIEAARGCRAVDVA